MIYVICVLIERGMVGIVVLKFVENCLKIRKWSIEISMEGFEDG